MRRDQPRIPAKTHAQKLGITPRLSDPIKLAAVVPNTPYLVVDGSNRILCPAGYGADSWDYAFFGTYADYAGYVMGASFDTNPSASAAQINLGPPQSSKFLHAYGTATSWEYAIWADSNISGSPALRFNAQSTAKADWFNLTYSYSSTTMKLCVDSGSWNWAYVGGSSYTAIDVSLRKFFLTGADLTQLFKSAWPDATIDSNSFRQADTDYELLDTSRAGVIYADSGLSSYKWIPDVFDCDDFSYVYKAQACRQAYADNQATGNAVVRSYALGVIWGRSANSAHAVNVFVDYTGSVKVLEPQNGSIVDAADWQDGQGSPYVPFFICF
jgi:hypothetical protein